MKTVLCVPGHDEAKVKKCRQYGADLILFDLEDSVPDSMKDRAREIVAANVQSDDHVRVNGWANGDVCSADINALFTRCASLWIPKSVTLADAIGQCVLIVETPLMVMKLTTLANTSQFVKTGIGGLAFGAADFAAYMNVPASSPQVQYARQQVALTAAALGVPAYDSPFTNLRPDSWGLFKDNLYQAELLGYQWKGVVHPAQIDVVRTNNEHERRSLFLVDEYVQKYDQNRGDEVVTVVDGQLVAPPMIRAARKRLEENK